MSDSLIRLKRVEEKTGLKKSMVYDLIKSNNFPKAVKIGERAVAWIESEIEQWIADRIKARKTA